MMGKGHGRAASGHPYQEENTPEMTTDIGLLYPSVGFTQEIDND
jgi:hypothetical protein